MATLINRIRRRRSGRLVCVLAVAGLVIPLTACSSQGSPQAPADSPLSINVKQQFMTIQNKAGLPANGFRTDDWPVETTKPAEPTAPTNK